MTIYKITPAAPRQNDITYFFDLGRVVYAYNSNETVDIIEHPRLNHSNINEWIETCEKEGCTIETFNI